MPDKTEEMEQLNLRVPRGVKRGIKSAAAAADVSMEALALDLLRVYLGLADDETNERRQAATPILENVIRPAARGWANSPRQEAPPHPPKGDSPIFRALKLKEFSYDKALKTTVPTKTADVIGNHADTDNRVVPVVSPVASKCFSSSASGRVTAAA